MARALSFKVDASQFYAKINSLTGIMQEGGDKGLEYASQGTVNVMRNRIETAGTKWSSFRFDSGGSLPNVDPGIGPGRTLSGDMLNSIGFLKRGKNIVMGYVHGVQQYFRYQEYGFTNWGTYIMPYTSQNGNVGGGFFLNHPRFEHLTPGIFALKDGKTNMTRTAPGLIKATAVRYANMEKYSKGKK
jgi:hypothetical protein